MPSVCRVLSRRRRVICDTLAEPSLLDKRREDNLPEIKEMNIFWRSPRTVFLCQAVSEIPFASGEEAHYSPSCAAAIAGGARSRGGVCVCAGRPATGGRPQPDAGFCPPFCTWLSLRVHGLWKKTVGTVRGANFFQGR